MSLPTKEIFGYEGFPYMRPLYTSLAPYFLPVTAAHGSKNKKETLYIPLLAPIYDPVVHTIQLNGMPCLEVAFETTPFPKSSTAKIPKPMPQQPLALMDIPSRLSVKISSKTGERTPVMKKE